MDDVSTESIPKPDLFGYKNDKLEYNGSVIPKRLSTSAVCCGQGGDRFWRWISGLFGYDWTIDFT